MIWFPQVFLLQLEAGRNFETFIVEYLRPQALFKHWQTFAALFFYSLVPLFLRGNVAVWLRLGGRRGVDFGCKKTFCLDFRFSKY